jgi:hypothetical protein
MAALSASPRISSYRSEIRSEGENRFSVDIAVSTGTEAWAKPAASLQTYDGERLTDIQVVSSEGVPLPWHIARSGRLDRLLLDRPGNEYRIHYLLQVNDSTPVRIPLAVPEIPTMGVAGSVRITVNSASGEVITGDMFPSFQQDGTGSWVAALSNVPNHVRLETGRAGEVGFRTRWLTPTMMTDVTVIALLAIGSGGRALIRRKREV